MKRTPIDADAGYLRVSEVRELEGEDFAGAIDRLIEIRATELREAAGKQSREIPDSRMFVDMDISGQTVGKRPDMNAMLEAAQRGDFARLWVKNISRLFRNLGEQIAFVKQIRDDFGVQIISLQEPSEGDRALLDLIWNTVGAVNQYMAQNVGQLVRKNNRIIASTGRLPGGTAPLGYRYDRITKELSPDPDRRADALAVFEIYAEIGTFIGAAERLNALGIRTRTGGLWRHDKVKAILTSPIYRGRIGFCGETWPGRHESIIPDELLARVEALVESTRHRWSMAPRSGSARTRTFSGLLVCGLCGDTMRAKPGRWNEKGYCYWTCSTRQDRRGCAMPHYRTEELEYFVLEGLKVALSHELPALQAYVEAHPDAGGVPSPPRRGPSRPNIEAKMLRLATEYAEGHLPQTQYRLLMDRYQAQIRETEQPTESPAQRTITPELIERFRAELDGQWADAKEGDRRTLIQAIAPRIRVYPDKLILHTILSIGDITIPTMMFEQTPARPLVCRAPDRSEGSGSAKEAFALSSEGYRVRFSAVADHPRSYAFSPGRACEAVRPPVT